MARTLVLLALAALALAPLASAHTTVLTSDGNTRIVVGLLNEPVVTYAKTGLDLCFTRNTTAREPVTINPADLKAVLRSPANDKMELDLRSQFGRAGCYQFEEPFIPTMAGQYVVDLTGLVNGVEVGVQNIKAGGAVISQGNITFPQAAPDLRELQGQVQALQTKVAQLEAKSSSTSKGAPMSGVLVLAGVALVAVVLRRKAD